MQYLGDFAEDATVYIPFNTFDSNDPQASVTITNLANADIKVHKDGGLTQIATDGATIAIDYDGITGNHLITIDTSVHADYAIGSDYIVRIEGTTVDAGTINAFVGSFSIENRFNAAADDLANATDGLGALKTLIDTVNTDLANGTDGLGALKTLIDTVNTDLSNGTDGLGAIKADTAAVLTDTADMQPRVTAVEVDTNELQGDWVNGGRLDLLLDAIPTTAMRGTDSAALASDWTSARAALIDEITAVRMATLTDWINGGRLDVLLDAIPTTAMRGTDNAALAAVATEARLAELDAANIPADVDSLLSRLSALRAGYLDNLSAGAVALQATLTALNNISVANIWNELMASYVTADSAGKLLSDAGAGGDPWATALPGAYGAGTAGKIIGDNIDAVLSALALEATLTVMKGATYAEATDSLEALRDRGDAAWTTGAGGTPANLLQNTTIATLASQTSFTLTAGSADNDAYKGALIVITDSATAVQKAFGRISAYVGSTLTVTLESDPAVFTMAVGDTVDIFIGENVHGDGRALTVPKFMGLK